MDHLVLTVFAPDKAGQVERIAQCIAEHGGNWLESRLSRMAGQFAGILRVGVPAEAYDELVDALQGLSAQGIRVLIAESGIEQSCTWKPIAMELVGKIARESCAISPGCWRSRGSTWNAWSPKCAQPP